MSSPVIESVPWDGAGHWPHTASDRPRSKPDHNMWHVCGAVCAGWPERKDPSLHLRQRSATGCFISDLFIAMSNFRPPISDLLCVMSTFRRISDLLSEMKVPLQYLRQRSKPPDASCLISLWSYLILDRRLTYC